MFNWKFTLITILLTPQILANQIRDSKEDFLYTPKNDLIYSPSAVIGRLPSLQNGHAYKFVRSFDDEIWTRRLYREHDLDPRSDYLDYLDLDEPDLDDSDLYSLVLRDAKQTKSTAKPVKESKADKKAEGNAAKAAKTAQENKAKANKKAQDQEKRTKDNAAKADKKAKNEAAKEEKQKQKDQKLVKDNLALEKKAQNRVAATAQRKIDGVQRKNQKDNANENKNFQTQQRKLESNLSKVQGDYNKQKGKKGEVKAAQNLAKAKAAVSNLPDQHKAKINRLYQQAVGQMDKDRKGLDKGLTKAHTDQFDASGKAKVHKSFWSKLGTVMSYLGPAALSFIPGVGAAMMGAMTAGRIAGAAAQAGVKEGVKNGVKAGTNQGTKKGTKEAAKQRNEAPKIDWKKQQPDQIQASQLNRDSGMSAYNIKAAQAAKAMRQQRRDVQENMVVNRLTPRKIYDSARRALIEDMIWDDLIYEDT